MTRLVLVLSSLLIFAAVAWAGEPAAREPAVDAPKQFRLDPMPTPEEWMKVRDLQLEAKQVQLEELDLLRFKEPDVTVLAIEPEPCPGQRREPSFEVLFNEEGKVAAFKQVAGDCVPLGVAWGNSIPIWQLRPMAPHEEFPPALFRVTLRPNSRPKSYIVAPKADEPPATE